jgi:hypothetical protein
MPDRSKKRPRDPNQLAYQIMLESTGQAPKYEPPEAKNSHAVALGRLGGLKGGTARAGQAQPQEALPDRSGSGSSEVEKARG